MSEPQLPGGRRPWPDDVVARLRCPLCASAMADSGDRLTCTANGHSFDRAKQGLVTLRDGHAAGVQADTAEMVASRVRVLESGTYAPLSADLAATVSALAPDARLVVDLAGGTGHHLAAVLEPLPDAFGLDLDLSTAALKRAARLHPRMFAVGADLMRRFPLADGCADAVTSVFGPRPADEILRILSPGAPLVVAVPTPKHLAEIVEPLGMISVDEVKIDRLLAKLDDFDLAERHPLSFEFEADRALLYDMVMMGPSAHHVDKAELTRRLGTLSGPDDVPLAVHASVEVLAFRARGK